MVEDLELSKLGYNIGKVAKYLSKNLCKLLPVREYKEYYEARTEKQNSNLEKTIARENLKKVEENKINKPPVGGVLRYFKKVNSFKEEFEEKSIDDLQKMINKYKKSFRSKFDVLEIPPKIAAIQLILDEKVSGGSK